MHRRTSGIDKFLETELQSERKQQHYDAYLGPELNIAFIGDGGQIFEIGAGKKAGNDVSEHHRLL